MNILFVCLGNICRSPMAEGVMKDLILKNNLDWNVDSAGTEYYHIGETPDYRAVALCKECGIDISHQRARKLIHEDFKRFDMIYVLADNVRKEIFDQFPNAVNHQKIKFLMDEVYPGKKMSVPDPWYGDEEDFKIAFLLIREACEAIIKQYMPLKTTK